jgi:FtsH-binding integral membrane protein
MNNNVKSVGSGVGAYMASVYNYLFLGLALTAVLGYFALSNLSWFFSYNQATGAVSLSGLGYAATFGPLAMIIYTWIKGLPTTLKNAKIFYFVFSALMGTGVALSLIRYNGMEIVRALAVTSVMFGAMSLYAHTTQKDLSAWKSFLWMGFFGLLALSIISLFVSYNSTMHFVISVMGVVIFAGFTAYDTQQIKNVYHLAPAEVRAHLAVYGALNLYIDFINLFLYLLRLLGGRRD